MKITKNLIIPLPQRGGYVVVCKSVLSFFTLLLFFLPSISLVSDVLTYVDLHRLERFLNGTLDYSNLVKFEIFNLKSGFIQHTSPLPQNKYGKQSTS